MQQETMTTKWTWSGTEIPDELCGWLVDSTDLLSNVEALRDRLHRDGYLFVRGLIDAEEVLAARREVFRRLAEVGEIKEPSEAGLWTRSSRRRQQVPDLGQFWQSVSEGPCLRRVTHGDIVRRHVSSLLGEEAQPHDYMWLRPWPPGRSTGLHYDHPFFSVGSQRVHTVWIPFGEVAIEDGPLAVVEGSQHFLDLIKPMQEEQVDATVEPERAQQAAYQSEATADPIAFVRDRQGRFLSQHFQVGDVMVFSMNTMHGSLDNKSSIDRIRLSCDVRYQPAADGMDPRYFGETPVGAQGGGYGEMKGALPLE